MAVKIDKELLIKHRFWIGLGLCILLVLVVLLMLPIQVGSAVEAKKTEYLTSLKNLQGIKDVKNQYFVDALKTKDGHVEKKKNEVWGEAWKTQEGMMTWPPGLDDWYKHYPYFGDKIDLSDRNKFASEYDYQLYDVINACQQRLDEKGEGVVQYNGGWSAVLGLKPNFVPPPSDEDIWLAQEDLWVKRELLAIIREANSYVARFTEVVPEAPTPPPAPPKKDDKATADADKEPEKDAKPAAPPAPPKVVTDPMHRKYRNSFWELDLKLTRNDKGIYSIGGTIKNVGKAKQTIDTDFLVYLDDTIDSDMPFANIHAARLPMNVGESFTLKDTTCEQNKSISGIYAVEQLLTWQTVPVKRIDKIELGYASSRTANRSLKLPIWIPKPEAPAEGGDAGAGGPPEGMGMGSGRSRQGVASSTASDQSKSGLNKNRYTDANAQVRHMPIAMAVLMDEDHIHDFLGALANSRLKIQTLQIHWNHSRDKIKPSGEEDPDTNTNKRSATAAQPTRPTGVNQPPMPPSGMGTLGRRPDMGGMGREMGRGMGGGGRQGQMGKLGGGFGFGGGFGGPGGSGFGKQVTASRAAVPGTSATSASEEDEPMTLVELSVYGLATLYERFPGKPEAPAEGAAAAK
jgi:hypothetical protein